MKALFLLILIFSFSIAELRRNNSLKVVVDSTNGLMWIDRKDVILNKFTHKESLKYCNSLEHASFLNWRIPSIKELNLIVDKRNSKSYINKAFRFNIADGFWAKKAHWRTLWFYADYMYFVSGTAYFDSRHKKKYVRCVRNI